ncbi:MAG: FAD-dependent oxidoreductase [Cyclobacteriaceae bacterium]
MKIDPPKDHRNLKKVELTTDLVVIGGGMAGTCCAITAARQGIRVVLIQDRPVLGGNASSEVRLWILGATSHMGNNNRWAREGGVIDEILVENTYRNPEGNTIIFDTILLEKVTCESNIALLLNTSVFETLKSNPDRISSVLGFCSQNSTMYDVQAPLFCDASGDGIVGFQAGAAFRMGAEAAEEFDEPFAPDKEYGELLGHSMYFMTRDQGRPVRFVAPDYALKDITKIPRYRKFNVEEHGCWLWWIEYGGRLDTVHDTEVIKWELWKVIYGVWNHIKNSGEFPEAENMTLEWVGQIPGKRESRRFEGHYILKQSDIVGQQSFYDTVGHGGWAIDLHPADGIFSEKPGCNQWHSKGIYEIPYRCMISKNISNLFLAGRIISASHVAFGSTRVMATCAHNAQAVGVAAALAAHKGLDPVDITKENYIKLLQQELLRSGQHIPHVALEDDKDLVRKSQRIIASKRLQLSELPFDGEWMPLDYSVAQLLPLSSGRVPRIQFLVSAKNACSLTVTLRCSEKQYNYTPDVTLGVKTFDLVPGEQKISLEFDVDLQQEIYVFICFHQQEEVSIQCTKTRITGVVSVFNKHNKAVSNFGRQDPEPGLGFESFEFWVPIRRPGGQNIAMNIEPPLTCFGEENIVNGFQRPYIRPNAWVADLNETNPDLTIEWDAPQNIGSIVLSFDTDWDYAMESSLLGHAENIMPFVIRDYKILDQEGQIVYQKDGNYQTRNVIEFSTPITTNKLVIQLVKPSTSVPASLFSVSCYPPQ